MRKQISRYGVALIIQTLAVGIPSSYAQAENLIGTSYEVAVNHIIEGAKPSAAQTINANRVKAKLNANHLKQPVSLPVKAVAQSKKIVVLQPKYISKDQASQYARTQRFRLTYSYAIYSKNPAALREHENHAYYYVNWENHKIGVAYNKQAAKYLTQSSGRVFSARKNETLKAALTRWAQKAGYEIQWLSSYDYKLQYSYEFTGSLAGEFGPLNKILKSVSENNYELKAVITKNKVILIKDNDYSPSILSH